MKVIYHTELVFRLRSLPEQESASPLHEAERLAVSASQVLVTCDPLNP